MKQTTKSTYQKLQAQVGKIVDSDWFSRILMALILINAVGLGLETYPALKNSYGQIIVIANRSILIIFIIELFLRILAHGKEFYKDPWSLFDFTIISLALLPANSHIAVLRIARIFRIMRLLRLLSLVPTFRRIVESFVAGFKGICTMGLLLFTIHYIYGIIGTTLFGNDFPEFFGTLHISMLTLFQLMILDNWSDVTRSVMKTHPYAWIYAVSYVVLTAFIVMNLVVAVMVDALSRNAIKEIEEQNDEEDEDVLSAKQILVELKAIRRNLDFKESREKEGI